MNTLIVKNNADPDSLHLQLLSILSTQAGKRSFLVFKKYKYFTVPTESIAFFYVKHGITMIKCFDGNEYTIRYSLKEVQELLNRQQFFRLNRQFLVNFSAIKETEHYFARKLLVNTKIPAEEKLFVTKENVSGFLRWLEER